MWIKAKKLTITIRQHEFQVPKHKHFLLQGTKHMPNMFIPKHPTITNILIPIEIIDHHKQTNKRKTNKQGTNQNPNTTQTFSPLSPTLGSNLFSLHTL